MAFDIEGARKAGYSDGEIADYLGKESGFDVAGAQKAGYTPAEIVGHLTASRSQPKAPEPAKSAADIAASEEPAFSDPSGTGASEIMAAAQPKRISVLEGRVMPEPKFDAAEAERLSNRAYAEASPHPDKPAQPRQVLLPSGPRVGPTAATERGEALQDAAAPVRAVFKGVSGVAQGVGGVIRAAGDLTGIDALSRAGAETSKGAEEFERGMGTTGSVAGFGPKSPVPYLTDQAEGAASSLGQSAAFASMFGPAVVIPLMSIQTAGTEYDKARTAGMDPAMALAGALPKGIFEAVGEKFTGLDKVASAMGTILTKGASEQAKRGAADILVKSGIKEIPGEVITYLGQTGVDLLPGIGLNPDMTMGQFLDGLRDTVVQAGMMGGAMGVGGAAAGGRASQPRAPISAAPTARVDPIAAITSAPTVDAAIAAAQAAVNSSSAVDNIQNILATQKLTPAASPTAQAQAAIADIEAGQEPANAPAIATPEIAAQVDAAAAPVSEGDQLAVAGDTATAAAVQTEREAAPVDQRLIPVSRRAASTTVSDNVNSVPTGVDTARTAINPIAEVAQKPLLSTTTSTPNVQDAAPRAKPETQAAPAKAPEARASAGVESAPAGTQAGNARVEAAGVAPAPRQSEATEPAKVDQRLVPVSKRVKLDAEQATRVAAGEESSYSDDPARWEYETENRAKNPGKVVFKDDNFSIEHSPVDPSNPYGMDVFKAVDAGGKVIGTLDVALQNGKKAKGVIQVAPRSRRTGVASSLYSHAEKTLGVTFSPDTPHTKAAAALWAQPNREFGKGAEPAQEPVLAARAAQGKQVSFYPGKYGKGMGMHAAKLEAQRLNRVNAGKGVTYAAEEHGDAKLENPWAVVGRKADSPQKQSVAQSTQAKSAIEKIAEEAPKKPEATEAPQFSRAAPEPASAAQQATDILDAAGVTGKERLDALVAVKTGNLTPDELEAAYPAKVDDSEEFDDTDTADVGAPQKTIQRTDDMFALPRSEATSLEQIVADNDPGIQVKKTANATGRTEYEFTMPDGKTASMAVREHNPYATEEAPTVYGFDMVDGEMTGLVTERPGENANEVEGMDDVWIDVSRLKSAGDGAKIYNIAATYAHNNGMIFIGDPAGLSDVALRRRTEQMISSALKFGTTEHLAPHPRQVEGDAKLGVPPLKWVYGDDEGNLERMIDVAIKATDNVFPTAKSLTYDLDAGTFRNAASGRPVPFGELAQRIGEPLSRARAVVGSGAGKAQAGWRTVARAALYRAIREAASNDAGRPGRGGILDWASQHGAGFSVDGSTGRAFPAKDRIFYSEREQTKPAAVRNPSTVDRVQAAVAELIGGKQLPNRLGRVVSTTASEIKSYWEPQIGMNVQLSADEKAGAAQAFYDPRTKTVFLIADHIPAGDEQAVAAHELMHKHGQTVLGAEGWEKLHTTINGWANAEEGSDERAVYTYARRQVEAVGEELSSQEMFPYAVEAALKMGVRPSLIAKKGTVARWLGSVKYAMQQAWGKVTGKPETFKTQDLVDLAFGIAQMENPESAAAMGKITDAPVNTDSPEFERWFGDSKVVDDAGKPLLVYHGTPNTEFTEFLPGDGAFGEGMYFADTRAGGDAWASGGRTIEAYLSLRNPYTHKAADTGFPKNFPSTDELKKLGHDGVIVTYPDGSREFVAFRPEQIKSAIGNNGDFDPANPDIRFSRAPAPGSKLSPWKDATGRMQFAPGAWLYANFGPEIGGAAAGAATGAVAGPVGSVVGAAIGALTARKMIDRLSLKAASPELRRQLRQMKLDVEKAQETAVAIARETTKLSEAERAMVSDLVEQELKVGVIPPAHAVKLAAMINDAMGRQTDELVALDMLTKDSADKWRGKYLPRYYESKLSAKVGDAWADAMKRLTGRQSVMKGIKGKNLKGRGLYETIPEDQLKDYEALGWEVRDPDFTPGQPSPDGTVQVWRDFSPAEREKMGEIRDAGFRFVMGYMQTQRDIAVGRMFERMAADPAQSSRLEKEGYVQVPTTTVSGTGAKVYGKLAGRWVPTETLSQLSNIEESTSAAWQMYRKAMGIWKEGKALALDTPLPTPTGWTTMGAIQPGDMVFDEQGKPCEVTYATDVQLDRECYEVEFSDGTKIVADAEHLWLTKYHGKASVKTTARILETLKEATRGDNNHSIPVAGPLQVADAALPIPPYALGAWLGDGTTSSASICAGKADADEMAALVRASGLVVGAFGVDKRNGVVTFGIRYTDASLKRCEGLQPTMRAMGLLGNKHIPAVYLRASPAQRLELLQGLMDTDGHITEEGKCEFSTTSAVLCDGVLELLRSLGFKPVAGEYRAKIDGRDCGASWRIKFQAYADRPVFKMARKVARLRKAPDARQRSGTRQIVAVRPVPSVPVKCIQVSSESRLYLAGAGMVPTHNTALNPVSHVNNMVSNLTMAHLAGVSYHRGDKYLAAARDFVKKGPMMAEAKENGLFLGTLSDTELMNSLPEELRILAQRQESKGEKVARTGFDIMTMFLRKPMGTAYQAEDTFFRYLIYKDARENGLEPQDAVDYAQKYIFTYDDLPKGARRIRDFGIPFFSYTYKAAPALLHTALTHPVRMAVPAALFWGINAAAYALATGDDDDSWQETLKKYLTDPEFRAKTREKEKLEREHLPPWNKGTTALLTPKTLRLGMDEVTKLPLFIDISRIIPGGDLFDVSPNAGGLPIPQPITPSHPLFTTMVAMLGNKDMFLGKEIVDSNDTRGEASSKRAAWLWKQLTPAITAGNYHWERGMNALAQANGGEVKWVPDILGGDATGIGKDGNPVQPKYAAMQTFGIKVRPVDLETAEAIEGSMKRKMIRDIDGEIKKLDRLFSKGAISERTRDKEKEKAIDKKQNLINGLTVDGDAKD